MILIKAELTLEAQYIAGYSVECSLKAVILETTPVMEQIDMLYRLTHGASNHKVEVLLGRLGNRKIFLPDGADRRMRRFDWTVDLRYETGRKDTGETNGLLRTARMIYEWAREHLR